ncbi:MAG: hypothetical protein ACREX3_05835 [Gammaproteobacteria bacterium]
MPASHHEGLHEAVRYATPPETPLWAVDRAVMLYQDALRRDAGVVAFLAATAHALAEAAIPVSADRGGRNGSLTKREARSDERTWRGARVASGGLGDHGAAGRKNRAPSGPASVCAAPSPHNLISTPCA